MSTRAMWWWRGLLALLVALTIHQIFIDGHFGILFIWGVPIYQISIMTPEVRRRLLTGRGPS